METSKGTAPPIGPPLGPPRLGTAPLSLLLCLFALLAVPAAAALVDDEARNDDIGTAGIQFVLIPTVKTEQGKFSVECEGTVTDGLCSDLVPDDDWVGIRGTGSLLALGLVGLGSRSRRRGVSSEAWTR